jgi:hypothetical protein
MPGEPNEPQQHEPTSMAEQLANDLSSKTGSTASGHPAHPAHQSGEPKGINVQFLHHEANPGPVVPEGGVNVQQEGTKEERIKRMEEMNK